MLTLNFLFVYLIVLVDTRRSLSGCPAVSVVANGGNGTPPVQSVLGQRSFCSFVASTRVDHAVWHGAEIEWFDPGRGRGSVRIDQLWVIDGGVQRDHRRDGDTGNSGQHSLRERPSGALVGQVRGGCTKKEEPRYEQQ